jgi:hypothetical protein
MTQLRATKSSPKSSRHISIESAARAAVVTEPMKGLSE